MGSNIVEETISRGKIKKKIRIIQILFLVIAGIVGGVATVFLSNRSANTSTVTAHVMISPKANYDLSGGTILDLVRSQDVLGEAIKEYNDDFKTSEKKLNYSKMYNDLTVVINGNSRLVSITAGLDSRGNTTKFMGLITKHMQSIVEKEMPAYNFTVVSESADTHESTPGFGMKQSIFLGAMVGVLLGCAVLLLVEGLFVIRKSHSS